MDNQYGNTPDNNEVRPLNVGVALCQARERLGLSVADVANRLKFASRQIEALEEEDFARLPEMAFVRGFVRSYAKLLQLDPVPLLAVLPHAQTALPLETAAMEVPFPNVYAERRHNIIWMAAGLAVAVALGLFVWLHDRAPVAPQLTVETLVLPDVVLQPASVVAVTPLAAPAPAPADAADADQAGVNVSAIRLAFDEDSWVKVTDKDGKVLLAQLNLSGSERRRNGMPPFSLVIGNAGGVRLYYQGRQVDLALYSKGGVARLTLE